MTLLHQLLERVHGNEGCLGRCWRRMRLSPSRACDLHCRRRLRWPPVRLLLFLQGWLTWLLGRSRLICRCWGCLLFFFFFCFWCSYGCCCICHCFFCWGWMIWFRWPPLCRCATFTLCRHRIPSWGGVIWFFWLWLLSLGFGMSWRWAGRFLGLPFVTPHLCCGFCSQLKSSHTKKLPSIAVGCRRRVCTMATQVGFSQNERCRS